MAIPRRNKFLRILANDFMTITEQDKKNLEIILGSEALKDIIKEVEHLKKTNLPRCVICKKNMENVVDKKTGKINPHLWQSTCEHGKGLILSRG